MKFRKKGTVRYYCDIHPGMQGKIVVKRKHAKIPTGKQDKKRVKAQLKLALKRAKKLPTSSAPAKTVYVGGSAAGGVEYFGMLPATADGARRDDREVRDVVEVVRGPHGDVRSRESGD